MKTLLTGGAGFIGSHTATVLAEASHKIIIYDNFSNSDPDVIDQLNYITSNKVKLVEGDIRNKEYLIDVLKTYEIDTVIHFAGLKAVGESVTEPLAYYDNNIIGTINLLEAMQAVCVKTLVFSSSATVYGDPNYLPIDEDHPTKSTNPYGRTKLMIEEILRDLADSDPEWKIVCLRYFNPVGAHSSGLIGEKPKRYS